MLLHLSAQLAVTNVNLTTQCLPTTSYHYHVDRSHRPNAPPWRPIAVVSIAVPCGPFLGRRITVHDNLCFTIIRQPSFNA